MTRALVPLMNELNTIRVPRGLEGLAPLELDMADIRRAEARLGEVALTNSHRAPELLTTFNKAWLDTSKCLNLLEYEIGCAERRMAEIRAIFLIDKLPALLTEKGLATSRSPLGSEDIRQAFLDKDADYKRMQELIGNIECYISLFHTIQKGFENAYNSVKKLIGGAPDYRPNANLPQPLPHSNGYPTPTGSPLDGAVSDDFFGDPK